MSETLGIRNATLQDTATERPWPMKKLKRNKRSRCACAQAFYTASCGALYGPTPSCYTTRGANLPRQPGRPEKPTTTSRKVGSRKGSRALAEGNEAWLLSGVTWSLRERRRPPFLLQAYQHSLKVLARHMDLSGTKLAGIPGRVCLAQLHSATTFSICCMFQGTR